MRFSVRHETHYRYSAPVRFTAHVLRLTPRTDHADVLMHRLIVDPEPSERQALKDRYGNALTRVEFAGGSSHLRIESRFEVETREPLAVNAGLAPLPWHIEGDDPAEDYLATDDLDESVRAFAARISAESGQDGLKFLDCLNRTLFTRTDRHIRPDGAAQTPAHTLATGKGACRDLTVLFMAACRSLGIPARFVSGYQAHAETPDGRRHLHSWAEVLLPGSGWRGYDPTHGLRVSDGHVALCAAPCQAATMPVEGGFYGEGVSSTLSFDVQIATRP